MFWQTLTRWRTEDSCQYLLQLRSGTLLCTTPLPACMCFYATHTPHYASKLLQMLPHSIYQVIAPTPASVPLWFVLGKLRKAEKKIGTKNTIFLWKNWTWSSKPRIPSLQQTRTQKWRSFIYLIQTYFLLPKQCQKMMKRSILLSCLWQHQLNLIIRRIYSTSP